MRAKASDRYLANQELADLARFPSENPNKEIPSLDGAARDRAPENEPVAVQDRRRETAADAAGRTGKTNSHCDLSPA